MSSKFRNLSYNSFLDIIQNTILINMHDEKFVSKQLEKILAEDTNREHVRKCFGEDGKMLKAVKRRFENKINANKHYEVIPSEESIRNVVYFMKNKQTPDYEYAKKNKCNANEINIVYLVIFSKNCKTFYTIEKTHRKKEDPNILKNIKEDIDSVNKKVSDFLMTSEY